MIYRRPLDRLVSHYYFLRQELIWQSIYKAVSVTLHRDLTGIYYPLSIYNPEVSISHIAQGMHRDFTGIYYRKVRIENLDSTRSHNSFFVVCSLFGTNIFIPWQTSPILTVFGTNIGNNQHKYQQYLVQILTIFGTKVFSLFYILWQMGQTSPISVLGRKCK